MTSETRNSIDDIWGERTPHGADQVWPVRVDERVSETPERWVRGTCVLCSNGCGLDIGVRDGRIVGVQTTAEDHAQYGKAAADRPGYRLGSPLNA